MAGTPTAYASRCAPSVSGRTGTALRLRISEDLLRNVGRSLTTPGLRPESPSWLQMRS